MRILAITGSLRRDSHNTRLLRHLAERAPEDLEIEIWDGLKSIPPYDEDDDTARRAAPGRRAARRDRRGRRPALRHPRIQLVDPGRAEERDRLGLAPAGDDPAPGQAGGGRRRDDRQLRRRLGAGRAAQGARLDRRPRDRPRPRRRPRARGVRRRAARCTPPTTASGSTRSSRRSRARSSATPARARARRLSRLVERDPRPLAEVAAHPPARAREAEVRDLREAELVLAQRQQQMGDAVGGG